MKFKHVILASTAFVFAFGQAKAADLYKPELPAPVVEAVTPAATEYRTSCYITGSVGMGITQADVGGITFSDNGATWGAGGGCDIVTGSFLLGALANASWTETGGSYDPSYQIGARAGVLVSPHVLAYATGGWTLADFGVENFDGYFVGGGVEILINQHLFAGLEYTANVYNDELGVDPMSHAVRARAGWRF